MRSTLWQKLISDIFNYELFLFFELYTQINLFEKKMILNHFLTIKS